MTTSIFILCYKVCSHITYLLQKDITISRKGWLFHVFIFLALFVKVAWGLSHFLKVVVDPSLGRVQLFVTPWTAACQAPLSFTVFWSLFKSMSIESVMPSNHLILCHPHLLLPSIFPSSWMMVIWFITNASGMVWASLWGGLSLRIKCDSRWRDCGSLHLNQPHLSIDLPGVSLQSSGGVSLSHH